jgi:hypothetical protein
MRTKYAKKFGHNVRMLTCSVLLFYYAFIVIILHPASNLVYFYSLGSPMQVGVEGVE